MTSAKVSASTKNVAICDESALYYLLHCDTVEAAIEKPGYRSPFANYATSIEELRAFNTKHPLFGGEPVIVATDDRRLRVRPGEVKAHLFTSPAPPHSFFELRSGLHMSTPELVFARMANYATEIQLVEIGMNLCARYYINVATGKIEDRSAFLTTPKKLETYLESATSLRGHRAALRALRWVLPNSGSPEETRMKIQFANPLWQGAFALPFTMMNYDVSSGRLRGLTEQDNYSIDMIALGRGIGLEYDGDDSHQDPSKDKRRRNELNALGWNIFPIDKNVLYDPAATERLAYQLAKAMGVRLRKPRSWETKYVKLRMDLGLPV